MKYTSQDFTFDHPFDFIRYFFSGLIFAPFRFTNELTRKIPYLTQDNLVKVNVWSIAINVILIVIDLINRLLEHNWNPLRGRIPLVTYLGSLAVLCLLFYVTVNMHQPKFKVVDNETRKANKEKRESLNKEQTPTVDEEYIENEEDTEENNEDSVPIIEYDDSELTFDNVDNLTPAGISQTIEKEVHLDVDDLELAMDAVDFEEECEVPSDVSMASIDRAIEEDKFGIEGSGLEEINDDCIPNISDLNFEVPTDPNDIQLDFDAITDDVAELSIDLSTLNI